MRIRDWSSDVCSSDLSLGPSALIAAILKARVDLLWFGGIGTYIKAAGETNAQVGDRGNDAHRVNGRDVRARGIGEGANLGGTQAGRVEYAVKESGRASCRERGWQSGWI